VSLSSTAVTVFSGDDIYLSSSLSSFFWVSRVSASLCLSMSSIDWMLRFYSVSTSIVRSLLYCLLRLVICLITKDVTSSSPAEARAAEV
jgi:hypothetical protein